MKSNLKKRILAFMLCMVMVLSNATSALAEETNAEEAKTATETQQEAADEPVVASDEANSISDTTTEQPQTETTEVTTQEVAPAAEEPTVVEEPVVVEEPIVDVETPFQEAMDLRQDLTDANGAVYCTVSVHIPEGTFQAYSSEVSMEVTGVDAGTEEVIKGLMQKTLTEKQELGEYFLYNVNFKVNGEVVEPGREVTITFEKQNFKVDDAKKANVFFYNAPYSIAGNAEAEIIDIGQRVDVIEAFQNAGQSIDHIDDYDLSEISLNEDGTAERVQLEGRRSTIYGCYVEKDKPAEEVTEEKKTEETKTEKASGETLTFENDDVTITVKEEKEGSIPKGTKLQVVPILPDDKKTKEQYSEVEDQLKKKAEDEEYSIAGFLAYDITLTDKDGKEIEPSGDVKVSIDYKKETVPEEVADIDAKDELNVTVMHLEENKKGAVKEVVDMVADETKEAAVETTENAEVKKAEFVTDSFSVFTVTWSMNGTYRVQLNSHYGYLDANGEFQEFGNNGANQPIYDGPRLPDAWIGTTYAGGDLYLDQYATDVNLNGTTYRYTRGVVSEQDDYSNGKYATRISMNRINNNYRVNYYGSDDLWRTLGNPLTSDGLEVVHIYFAYDVATPLTTVDTVDNTTAGITMTMKDLTNDEQVAILGEGGLTSHYNQQTYYNVEQDILRATLNSSGFPVARTQAEGRSRSGTGGSLESLFNGTTVNHLFSQETYNQTGYYEYSSFENYAYLGADNNFTVYNQIGTPMLADTLYYYNRGNFFPYNAIQEMRYSDNRNLYDEEGNALTSADARYNEKLYWTNGVNTHFSMNLDANFYQPRNGEVHHNNITSDMIYEFNGDDDLWVFIDGVLVLDIGGIHDAHSGFINFATGAIHVELGTNSDGDKMTSDTTIKDMYEAAGVFPDGTPWDDDKVDDYFRDNTFVDYSSHNMKMFYMERGGGASNLHIRFNLQTVPDGQIEITKNISNTDKESYVNEDFQFELYVQEETDASTATNPQYTNNYVQVTSANLTDLGITAAMRGGGDVRWSEDGKIFYLKPQQTATFSNLLVTQRYYVREIGVNSIAYDGVHINSVEVTEEFGDGNTRTVDQTTDLAVVTISKEQVYRRPAVGFTNHCSDENLQELRITKEMVEGQSTTDTFAFKIQFTNQSGGLADYAQGDYYLIDGEGNYYSVDGNGDLTSEGSQLTVCGQTSDEGVIEGIPVGYTVIITQLISGTEFKVEEVDLDQTLYADPVISVMDATCGAATVDGADGTILLGTNAEMTITNAKRSNTLIVKKVDAADNEITLAGAEFTIQEWNASTETYETIMINGDPYAITTGTDGLATFADLALGKYRVIETETLEGYIDTDPDYSFDIELPYTPDSENPDNTIQVDEDSQIGETGQYTVVTKTVENVKQDWEIIKRSSDSTDADPIYLADAEFELSSENTTYYGKSENDGTVAWYSSAERTAATSVATSAIEAGTYTLEETKAPAGHVRSTTTWTIVIGQNGSFISSEDVEDDNMVWSESGDQITLYFDNVPLQSLPSTGGSGVYGYWMIGALLMLAAALFFGSRKRFAR